MIRVRRGRAPDAPSSRIHHIAQIRRLERHPRPIAPRAAEVVDPFFCLHSGVHAPHTAVVYDIPRRVVARAPRRGYATCCDGHDVDLVQPGLGCLPEYEVDCAEDAGACVDLRAGVCE